MTAFSAPNQDYAVRVRDSFFRQPFMHHVGAAITLLEPGVCDVALSHDPSLTQQHGFFHGGLIGAIADNAGAYAAFTLAPSDFSILTVEFKVSFLSPARGESLLARGRVVKPGRTLVVSRSDIFAIAEGDEKLVATALVTLMLLEGRDDVPAPATAPSPMPVPA
jgi:uncharacterized protein (TIGR00369 family)